MKILVVSLLSLGILCAQDKQERGKRLVDDSLAALGGEKFLSMQDRVETGRVYSFYRSELSGLSRAAIYTRYLSGPNPPVSGELLVRERQSFGKDERSGAVLFSGDKGYEITFRGARPLPDDTLERYKLSTLLNFFYILRERRGEPGLIYEFQNSDIYENRPVDIVDITDSDNRTVSVYFDRSTKLPVRQLFYRRDPKTRDRIEEVSIFSKYRDVGGGVQWPYTIQRVRNGEKVFEIYSDTVAINQDLADNLFLLPADMKILKPLK